MRRLRGVATSAAVAARALAVGVDWQAGGQGKRENEHVGVACLGVKWAGGRLGFLSQGHGSQHGSQVLELERKVSSVRSSFEF